MGKMPLFTPEQELIFHQIGKSEFLKSNFYFTGGTALSCFYLGHRYSEDLDFFTEKKFEEKEILSEMSLWAKENNFTFKHELREAVYIFTLTFPNKTNLKIDFGYYPYQRVEKGLVYEGVVIDSLLDIAINKLTSVNQRSQVKDFVDLYFLLDKFTMWDLIEGVRVKFRLELDPWLLSSDLAYIVEKFTYLPKMIKPLTLEQLKKFFREKALELGRRAVTK